MREATAGAETALGEEHIVKIIISRGPTQAVTSMQPGPYTLIMASPVPASIVKRRTEGVKAMLLPRATSRWTTAPTRGCWRARRPSPTR